MQRIKSMTNNSDQIALVQHQHLVSEIKSILDELKESYEGFTEPEKLYLGAVIFTDPINPIHYHVFQSIVLASTDDIAKEKLRLMARDLSSDFYNHWSISYSSLYEVTPDSPEHFTLTKYFK